MSERILSCLHLDDLFEVVFGPTYDSINRFHVHGIICLFLLHYISLKDFVKVAACLDIKCFVIEISDQDVEVILSNGLILVVAIILQILVPNFLNSGTL